MRIVRRRNFVSLILNCAIIIEVIISVIMFFVSGGEGNMQVIGVTAFRYFTTDSNIFCALTCICVIPYNIKVLRLTKSRCTFTGNGLIKQVVMPKWALLLKFMGTVSVMVTFLTVVLFLGPVAKYDGMFSGNNLHLHLLCPIWAFLSYTFCEIGKKIKFKTAFLGLIPVLVYGTIYMYRVLVLKAWPDFYCFNSGILEGLWPFSFLGMLIATFIISIVIFGLHKASTEHIRV